MIKIYNYIYWIKYACPTYIPCILCSDILVNLCAVSGEKNCDPLYVKKTKKQMTYKASIYTVAFCAANISHI